MPRSSWGFFFSNNCCEAARKRGQKFCGFAAQKEFKSTFFLFFVSLPLFGVASRQGPVKNKISRFSILLLISE